MHSLNSVFKFLDGSRPKNPYGRLTKAEKAKGVQVPKGYVPVYVGKEEKMYEVPVKYLSLRSFQEVLAQSLPNELDNKNDGPIVLACTTEVFDRLLREAKASS